MRILQAGKPHPAIISSRVNVVATNLFDVFDVRVLAGRGFTAADANPHPPPSSSTRPSPIAWRRAATSSVDAFASPHPTAPAEPNPWMEVVGVVPVFSSDFTPVQALNTPTPSIYRAAAPGQSPSLTLVVKMRSGDPTRYGRRLQEITASVDPTMEVEFIAGVAELWEREQRGMRMIAFLVVAINGSVLLLSAAGIHAMMSFTVARRWREIGIRVALGADARRVLMGIFGRVGAQIASRRCCRPDPGWDPRVGDAERRWGGNGLILFPAVAAVMFAVGLLAAAGPARRGLSVQPTEALRTE